MSTYVSERARAIMALQVEIDAIGDLQLEVGEEMAKLMTKQIMLAMKSDALSKSVKKILEMPL